MFVNSNNSPLKHKITNLNIVEKLDKNGNPYYLFFDNNMEGQKGNMWVGFVSSYDTADNKKNWETIIKNHREINEVEFEYTESEKGRKISNLLNVSLINY